MSNNTSDPGTDPELGSEVDSDQLTKEDTLLERGVDDLLDEGYSPPERDRNNHFGETAREESTGESLDQHLAQEEPDVWDRPDIGGGEPDRAGRLVADSDALDGRVNDTFAEDEGVAGGAATAEEAAMHVIQEP
ncbi:hypothetical protein SAMN05216410_1579 [Sanguibacter gelidistatuariae]|uniref:DUF5709 domain-containing protein n=1 Tax=Sanguibacter gelidistatuariae TaxID=1814289 RepID=A0A1G6KEM6_9MICO|nr:DUF5709 domain-containing protein [Sanguibacter gelidistatuariae]SDC29470.1 hypothetical protein SAMN05216410_1579 [Sanguibacter gelidistatuariae]